MAMIAIVDDDEAVRRATGRLLRSLGYRVATFATGKAFLKSGELHETSCLIIDVHMPGMSGFELQARLKAEGHHMPIIVITAFPDDGVRDYAVQHGASAFLTKPFSKESLAECLDRALKSDWVARLLSLASARSQGLDLDGPGLAPAHAGDTPEISASSSVIGKHPSGYSSDASSAAGSMCAADRGRHRPTPATLSRNSLQFSVFL
jgi:CheY-like chemotaxis protein